MDEVKQTLLGFNEKVSHLENTRFYQRYKDEPPNLLMSLDRIDRMNTHHIEGEPGITLTFTGYMRFAVENFNREEIDSFVLTYRILTQRNDRYSILRLADIYNSSWIDEDGRRAFAEAHAHINEILDSPTRVDFGEGPVRVKYLVDVLIYGALAHSNSEKEQQYKAWTENPTMAAAVWIEFMAALRSVMEVFRHIKDINSTLLFNVFKVDLPAHLITLEISCIRPGRVDAESEKLFKETVAAAGEVNQKTLPALYRRAQVICFARLGGELTGVGALKRPYTKHRAKIFEQAKSTLDPQLFAYEIGWFHVLERFKGLHISSHMVEQLMRYRSRSHVYATSRIDNLPMHSALTRHGGFVREGSDYTSELGDVPLCLFVHRDTKE